MFSAPWTISSDERVMAREIASSDGMTAPGKMYSRIQSLPRR